MTKEKTKNTMIFAGALITLIGGIITAFISGKYSVLSETEPLRMKINATSTAEVKLTQAINMAATITAVVEQDIGVYTLSIPLSGGHTPPSQEGGSRPDTNNDTDSLYTAAYRIQIPAIEIDAPIVQGDGWEQLKKGVGQKLGTSNPGENGFIILSAHNDIYGEIFRDLDKLQPGDEIKLYSSLLSEPFSYFIESTKIVSTPDFEFTYNPNESMVMLTSSYPYLVDDNWIVVFAYP